MARTRRFWFGLAVSLVFLALFLRKVDVAEAVDVLRSANYLYLVPAIATYFGAVYFRSWRWQYLLRSLRPLGIGRLYPVVIVGYMANNLLPMRLGEVVRAYYLARRDGVSASASLATILVERVFDGLALLAFIAVVSLAVPVLGVVEGLADQTRSSVLLVSLALPLIFVGGISVLALMASFPTHTMKVALVVLRRLPSGIRGRVESLGIRFLEGLWSLRSPRRVLVLFLLSLPIWLTEAAMYLVLAYSFRVEQAFEGVLELAAAMLLLTAIANLAISLPSSPGGVGPFEFFGKATMVLLGVGAAQATVYVGILHLVLLVPVTLAGLVYLWTENVTLGRLAREVGTQANPKDGEPRELSERG